MSDGRISIELSLSPRSARFLLAALFIVLGAKELSSESVTLTTYYPAPSGVYTQMIATGNTWLARDGGGLSIGTTDVPSGLKVAIMGGALGIGVTSATGASNLVVNGQVTFGGNLAPLGSEPLELQGAAAGLSVRDRTGGTAGERWVIYSDRMTAGTPNTQMLRFWMGGQDKLTIRHDGQVHFNYGPAVFKYASGTYCTTANPMVYGAGVALCPNGTYATILSGVFSKYMVVPGSNDPTGNMLCCDCGPGGCPAF